MSYCLRQYTVQLDKETVDGMDLWYAQLVDNYDNKPFPNGKKFYSRFKLWAQAHLLMSMAQTLFDLKYTTTNLDAQFK